MSNEKAPLPERLLVASLTSLVIARCLIADDPGRLRLTSGGGPLTLNILTFVLLLGWAVWRGATRQPLRKGAGWVVVLGLVFVAGLSFASTMQPSRYQHAGWFVSWNWLAVAALCFVAWQMCSPAVAKGLVMVLLAMWTVIALQARYEWLAPDASSITGPKWSDRDDLVGGGDRGDLSPAYSVLVSGLVADFLVLPLAALWAGRGWRRGGFGWLLLALPIALFSGMYAVVPIPKGIDQAEFVNLLYNRPAPRTPDESSWIREGATGVLLAIVAVGLLLALLRRKQKSEPAEGQSAGSNGLRLAFYAGGITGLLLGMVLATGDVPAEAPAITLLLLGSVAAIRAVVWFFLFSLLEATPVENRSVRIAGALGTVFCVATGLTYVSSKYFGMLLPTATLQSLCLLVLISCQAPSAGLRNEPGRVAAWLPVPIALALLVANLLHVSLPGLSTASNIRDARAASKEFPELQWKIEGKSGPDRVKAVRDALGYVDNFIIDPLREANSKDEGNSALMVELARWKRIRWTYLRELHDFDAARREGIEMLVLAERAAKVDPENLGARWAVYEALLLFVQETTVATAAQLTSLEKYVGLIAEREPQKEVELRFRVVQALLTGRNPEAVDFWSVQLLKLENESGHGELTQEQRPRLVSALIRLPAPSAELQKYLPPSAPKKEPAKR